MTDDTIYRQDAIQTAERMYKRCDTGSIEDYHDLMVEALTVLPSAQPDSSVKIQEILDYLDTNIHPLVSPEHWNVYSELYDMISGLPSTQPERKKSAWIDEGFYADGHGAHAYRCQKCGGHIIATEPDPFCRWCGAEMTGDDNDKS